LDKVYQLLAQSRWFSPGTPASSITKTGHRDIAEILMSPKTYPRKPKATQEKTPKTTAIY
jgi:hypothetical protein